MNVLEEVTQLAERLSPPEQLRLVEHLAKRLQAQSFPARKLQSLRGTWKDKFPQDFDIDSDLREIREEWLKELDEL